MKVVNTYHGPTSVTFSLKCRLTSDPNLEFLVVARSNELDVYAILVDGLSLKCTLDVWGRVTSLKAVGSSENGKSSLLLTTDHPDPRLLLLQFVSGHNPRLECTKSISLHERNARPSEFFCGSIVSPTGDTAIVSSYVGKLKVLELSKGRYHSDNDTSVRELNLLSITFLRTTNKQGAVLALLHRDHNQSVVLTSHELSKLDVSPTPSPILPETVVRDRSASNLIAVPPHGERSWNTLGGVLVLAEEKIYFYSNVYYLDTKKTKKKNSEPPKPQVQDSAKPVVQIEWAFSRIAAWAQVDELGTRYLLGDDFGRLVLLAFAADARDGSKLKTLYLGETSSPTSLTVLPSQFVYVGSHFGDSQLIRIEQTKPSDGSHVRIVERFANIAPIMDAVLVDSDNTGQNEVVTCSGGRNSGSLRIIRNGVNFAVDALLDDVQNITSTWSLKSHSDDDCDSFIMTSTPESTHIYELPSSTLTSKLIRLTEEDFPGFKFDERTLMVANVFRRFVEQGQSKSHYDGSSYVVQVTTTEVLVVNMSTRDRESHWRPPDDGVIVLGDITPSQICVALAGGKVTLLKLVGGNLAEAGSMQTREVSALAFARTKNKAPHATRLAIGYWDDFSVQIFAVPKLECVARIGGMTGLPRSLLMVDFEEGHNTSRRYLVVGQGDGRVDAIPYEKMDLDDSDRRSIALGDSPIQLNKCYVEGRPTVLATGSRSALLSWKKDSIFVSPLLLKDTIAATPLHCKSYPSALVLASADGLTIGRILQIAKLHVRTVPMGCDNPVRIAYQAESRTFGIGRMTMEVRAAEGMNQSRSSFVILDAATHSLSHSFQLNSDEDVTAVEAVSLSTNGSEDALYAVGSMYLDAGEKEPTRGRILLFSVTTNKVPPVVHCIAEVETNGCVYGFACMKGKLIAAVNSGVHLYSLNSSPTNSKELLKLGEWNHNYIVTSIAVCGDKLITGDAVSSIAVLQLQENKFKTLARDYGPLWPLCIAATGDSAIIGSNSDNIFSFKLHQLADKMVLDQDGEFRIDEIVNKFISGQLSSDSITSSGIFVPKHVFFTSTGRIGVVTESTDETHSMNLTSLLRNLTYVVQGPGQITYADRRSPISARGKSDGHPIQGFVDGDFLEQFLDFDPSSQEARRTLDGKTAAESMKLTTQQIRSILESLRSFH